HVAGMDGVGTGRRGGGENFRDRQVAFGNRRRPDAYRAIGREDVQCAGVRLGMYRDALDAELAARAGDAHGDFASVRNEEALDHGQITAEGAESAEDAEATQPPQLAAPLPLEPPCPARLKQPTTAFAFPEKPAVLPVLQPIPSARRWRARPATKLPDAWIPRSPI